MKTDLSAENNANLGLCQYKIFFLVVSNSVIVLAMIYRRRISMKNNDNASGLSILGSIQNFFFRHELPKSQLQKKREEFADLQEQYYRLVDEQKSKIDEIHVALQTYEKDLLAETKSLIMTLSDLFPMRQQDKLAVADGETKKKYQELTKLLCQYPNMPEGIIPAKNSTLVRWNAAVKEMRETIDQRISHHEEVEAQFKQFLDQSQKKFAEDRAVIRSQLKEQGASTSELAL